MQYERIKHDTLGVPEVVDAKMKPDVQTRVMPSLYLVYFDDWMKLNIHFYFNVYPLGEHLLKFSLLPE